MLAFPAAIKIYVAVQPVDMRKSLNGLWNAACEQFQDDPKSGAVFCFINGERTRLKLLYWDGTGVWVLAKRLERGRFSWAASTGDRRKLALAPEALALLVGGVELKHGSLKPWYERQSAGDQAVSCFTLRVLTPGQKIAEQRIGALEAQLAWFRKQVFGGGKSEQLEISARQLSFHGIEATRTAIVDRTEKITFERTKAREPRPTPAEVFAHVPVTETVEIVPAAVQQDPEVYERIGEERTFEIDLTPPRLVKREIVRPKYRHRPDRTCAPLLAAAPARVVPGGYASAGLLASIIVGKYVDHLPLYRQEQMSARWGATISRRTMCDWIEVAAMWLEPVYRHLHRGLIAGNYLQTDETPIRCNDPDHDRGKTRQCYLWASVGRRPTWSSLGGSRGAMTS